MAQLSHVGQLFNSPRYMHGAGYAVHGAREIQKMANVCRL